MTSSEIGAHFLARWDRDDPRSTTERLRFLQEFALMIESTGRGAVTALEASDDDVTPGFGRGPRARESKAIAEAAALRSILERIEAMPFEREYTSVPCAELRLLAQAVRAAERG